MGQAVIGSMLALLLTLLPARAAQWPDWQLTAPLQGAGRGDLLYPQWFEGSWQVTSHDADGSEKDLHYPVRFVLAKGPGGRRNGVVGDRAFNAASVGAALLGPMLQEVSNDPSNPNRQLGRLQGDQLLESTVVARRSESRNGSFWADELSLQILHRPGSAPRVSQVETLSRYAQNPDGSISGEQWQATYPAPDAALRAKPLRSAHWLLRLEPGGSESDRSS